jgi:hypothetical protein
MTSIKIFRWLFFTVIFAVLPIIVFLLNSGIHGFTISFDESIEKGDFLLVSCVIVADSLAEIVMEAFTRKIPIDLPRTSIRFFMVGISMLLIITSCIAFSTVSTCHIESKLVTSPCDKGFIKNISIAFFVASIVVGLFSILLTSQTNQNE